MNRSFPRRAFTLAETLVSLAIMAALSLGMAGALVVVAKAAPATDAKATSRSRLNAAVDQLTGELRYLTSVRSKGATHIEFTVPDRDSDGDEEVIRYEWNGTNGGLMRSYNAAAAVEFVPAVSGFSTSFATTKTTTSQTTTVTQSSGDVLLSTFTGWPLVLTPTQGQTALTTTVWANGYFKVDQVTLPAGVTRLELTKLRLRMRRPATPNGPTVSVGIYKPAVAGGPNPSTTQVGNTSSLSTASLTTSFAWTDLPLSSVVTDGSSNEFNFVLKGTGTSTATLLYFYSILASANSSAYTWSNNSGGAWTFTGNVQYNDIPHEVWGNYSWISTATTNVDVHNLRTITLDVSAGTPATRLQTTVNTLNRPVVTP